MWPYLSQYSGMPGDFCGLFIVTLGARVGSARTHASYLRISINKLLCWGGYLSSLMSLLPESTVCVLRQLFAYPI